MPSLFNSPQSARVTQGRIDRLGRSIAQHLPQPHELPADVQARLQAARLRALAETRQALRPSKWRRFRAHLHSLTPVWWNTLAATAAVAAFTASFVLLGSWQASPARQDLAQLDTLLLTDDLPPEAYADPGFMRFLLVTATTESE